MEVHILKVGKDGLVVHLDDGSVWNISVGDNTKSICWYPTMRVIVEKSDSAIYPFILTNLDTAGPDVVHASPREDPIKQARRRGGPFDTTTLTIGCLGCAKQFTQTLRWFDRQKFKCPDCGEKFDDKPLKELVSAAVKRARDSLSKGG